MKEEVLQACGEGLFCKGGQVRERGVQEGRKKRRIAVRWIASAGEGRSFFALVLFT